jgi:hypothetical protein
MACSGTALALWSKDWICNVELYLKTVEFYFQRVYQMFSFNHTSLTKIWIQVSVLL